MDEKYNPYNYEEVAIRNCIFKGVVDLYVHNTSDLNTLLLNLSKIKGIESVHRMETIKE